MEGNSSPVSFKLGVSFVKHVFKINDDDYVATFFINKVKSDQVKKM